ncbi:cysteine desulfurase-like protein [Sphingomonas colocasiae]|uniref:Cysteine desulfurase-like protein n=1 Tax=Sphingomonas colocasiae TaxID=1848973 RepID=A0ABS7PV26_9SPHN|nr:cysteine desulfurase-like protein [Sphingomonas colocasiae]MBY8824794.1 cysteine desulfurase-like protein [Sphingomonas colocasiae]
MTAFPIDDVRAQFPALAAKGAEGAPIYLDGPGGTQICAPALAAMVRHLEAGTANSGGAFRTSVETDAMSEAAHAAMADLLGGSPDEIAFGPNMTTLTFAVSRAVSRDWREGDELVVTRLDHDANVTPWLMVAQDRGMTVRWIDLDPETGLLRIDALPEILGPRTRLVAVGGASNAIGTLNDVEAIVRIVRAHCDALVFVDAVQSVPHVVTDVRALGCDLLVCSPYKFFGPHQGVLWGRDELLERIQAYKVRPASIHPSARRFETGTPSFEGQAAVLGTIDYLETLGARFAPDDATRRERLRAAMLGCHAYEDALGERLLAGLGTIDGLKLWGPPTVRGRVPTFGVTIAGHDPHALSEALAAHDIFAWAGNFYAVEAIARLGLAESGGLLRLGLCHYNTVDEVDRVVDVLTRIVRSASAR